MKDIKIRQIFYIIFAVMVTGLFLRMFIVDSFIVKGDSMAPTILKGDYVFIDRISYLFKKSDYIFNRQDIVVAKSRQQVGRIIKRIIGLPGERLEISNNGSISIKKDRKDEGKMLTEDYLHNIANIAVIIPTVGLNTIKLDPKEYFVLGDNRYFSADSRELGPINEWDIEGRVFLIFRSKPFSFKFF